jgi:outer membrane protein TolC
MVAHRNDARLRGKWWEIFNEPELNGLEEQLNIDNQNIKQAFENFMAARALIREARAQYFSTLTTAPSYSRSRSSANLAGAGVARGTTGVTTFTGQQSSLYDLPFNITWAPDLWGRVRNTVRECQYGAQFSAADLQNERLIEQASLAEFYFEIWGQDMLQKILNQTVEADKQALELTQARIEVGIDNAISVIRQTTLETAQAINIGLARAQFEHSRRRSRSVCPPNCWSAVPTSQLPSAAWLRPIARSFAWSSRFWAIGGTLSETLFDAGLRRATVNQFIASYNATLAATAKPYSPRSNRDRHLLFDTRAQPWPATFPYRSASKVSARSVLSEELSASMARR